MVCRSKFLDSYIVYGNVWLIMYWSWRTLEVDSTISFIMSTTNSSQSSWSTVWYLNMKKKKEMVKAHWRIAEGILSVSSKQLHVKYRIENVTK